MTKRPLKHMVIASILAVVAVVGLTCWIVLRQDSNSTESPIDTFTLEAIDDYSPDQKIKFYAGDNEVDPSIITQVALEDGLVLCEGEPFVVNVFELEGVDRIIVTTANNQKIILTKKQ